MAKVTLNRDFADLSIRLRLGLVCVCAIANSLSLYPLAVLGQTIPDSTLGSENSTITPGVHIRGNPADLIQGGAIRSHNLFHSFSNFNVQALQRVYFANPQGIENIISRVTGSNPSNILGLLGVDGNANLFLLNPNGIIFGPDAQLDVAGSFIASTADRFIFPDGSEFSATNPQAPPLLTINLTPGLQYGAQPAAIVNAGNLAVGAGENLTLAGGSVVTTGSLSAPGGTLSVVAVPGNQVANLDPSGAFLSLTPIASTQSNYPSAPANPTSLQTLLENAPDNLGVKALANNSIELTSSGTQLLANPGTAIVSGTLNASVPHTPHPTPHTQTGGTIQVLGHRVALVDSAQLEASGALGGGTLLIGGDFQGDGTVPNAKQTIVGPDVTLNANALTNGKGGRVIVWADEATHFSGTIGARGGAEMGDGGFVEVSGKEVLQFQGLADTSAANGQPGTLLLDPTNIIISDLPVPPGFSSVSPFDPVFLDSIYAFTDNPNQNSHITPGAIAALLFTNSLTLQATNDIIISNAVFFPSSNSLTLQAGGDLQIDADITSTLGGSLNLEAGQTLSIDNSTLTSLASATAKGGDFNFSAPSIALSNNATVATVSLSAFAGGTTNFNAQSINLDSGATVATSTSGPGAGGAVNFNAQSINLDNGANVVTETSGAGAGGAVHFNAQSINLDNRGTVATSTSGLGMGGTIDFNSQSIALDRGAAVAAETSSKGAGGTLNFNTASVVLDNNSVVGTRTTGVAGGQGGDLTIDASESVDLLNGGILLTNTTDAGDSGNLTVNTRQFRAQGSGSSATSTSLPGGSGDAGDLTINAIELVELIGSEPGSFTFNTDLSTALVLSQIQTGLASATQGSGSAGNLTIETARFVARDGAGATSGTTQFSTGSGGNLTVIATEIDFQGKGGLSVATLGSGVSGNLRIDADRISLQKGAAIAADTVASGDAGSLMVNTNQLELFSGSRVGASTSAQGMGGRVVVNATDAIEVVGTSADGSSPSGLFANSTGIGRAGDLQIMTRHLRVRQGGEVSASTTSQGQGGNVMVNATESVELYGANSKLAAQAEGTGNAGNLAVNTQQFVVRDGAQATTSTAGRGQGGTLMVNASQFVDLDNEGSLLAQSMGAGAAGSLTVRTGELRIENNSKAAVSSLGTGDGGTLDVMARNILLDRQGRLIAETASGDGGNIRLRVEDTLLMRRNSLISATAGGGGQGGNIDIEAMFAIAVPTENSDIIANAFQGQGGAVQIAAQGIFGLQFRTALTPLSDITASSQLGTAGTVQLNTPDVDPSQDLTVLPTDVIDPSELITQTCPVEGNLAAGELSEFAITGRGNLPPIPSQVLRNEGVLTDWVSLERDVEVSDRETNAAVTASATPELIVEARGWKIGANGNPILTAEAMVSDPQSSWQQSPSCKTLQQLQL